MAEERGSAADLEFFEREVRPILANRCYECHSGRTKNPKGGLRVDSRSALLAGGDTGPAVVPGKPSESLLVDSINYGETYQMPPKSRLPPGEVATLTKWVERGAPWPAEVPIATASTANFDLEARKASHWCWRPVQVQPLPEVRNSHWPRQDLDRFILAKLEARKLPPAPPADRHMLLRRVYFDLIGLSPTPEQVAAFLRDESPRALEQAVDELLKSPHFGETWARHWMDLVRYAETCGHEFDYPIHSAWRYRDYLIRAFNADVPYDQFVLEHIAGDLLPTPRLHPEEGYNESVIGTGFWFLHEAIHAPVDVRGDEAGRIDNQIDVFSKTFLGLTVSCARCHDHKFDAISTKDYYALAGFLRSSRRQEAFLDLGGKIHEVAQSVAERRRTADIAWRKRLTELPVLSAERLRAYLLAAREVLQGEPRPKEPVAAAGQRRAVATVAEQFNLPASQLEKWVVALTATPDAEEESPLRAWRDLALSARVPPGETEFATWREPIIAQLVRDSTHSDYQVFADFERSSFDGWFVTGEAFGRLPTTVGQWDPLSAEPRRIETGAAHGGQLAPRFQGVLRSPTFTLNSPNIYYRMAGQGCEVRLIIDGHTMIEFHQLLLGGTKFPINTDGKWVWHRQSGDLGMYLGHRAHIEVLDHGDGWAAIDQICFSQRDTSPPFPVGESLSELAKDPAMRSLEQLAERLAGRWSSAVRRLNGDQPTRADARFWNWLAAQGLLHDEPAAAQRAMLDWAAVVAAGKQVAEQTRDLPSPPRVTAMVDGTGENERVFIRGNPRILGDEVPRRLLESLTGAQAPIEQGSGRLTLARQVADPANPLTARVLVNRVWHHLFGVGIVPTVDNLGVLGEAPTHPELLDYLAHQFTTEGWSLKRLIRTLVLSSSYQMSSAPSVNDEADPVNRLWHRTNIRRLTGEEVRDALLQISGRLDRTLYGPGIPVHITPFMQGRGKPGTSGPLDGAGRRTVYTEVRRNFLPPMLLAFDTPIPFSTVGRRNTSNVPAQALILMNDPLVVEQTQLWAKRLLSATDLGDFDGRVRAAYVAAIARPPTEKELVEVGAFFESQRREYQSPAAKASQAATATTASETGSSAVDDPRIWADFCHVLCNVKEFVFLQ